MLRVCVSEEKPWGRWLISLGYFQGKILSACCCPDAPFVFSFGGEKQGLRVFDITESTPGNKRSVSVHQSISHSKQSFCQLINQTDRQTDRQSVSQSVCQWLFTIYTGKPVGLPFGSIWANGKQISVLGKFRSRLTLTICRNPYHLPKNLHDGDGWQEGRKTKALINKTMTLHTRYFWYISLPFCAQLQLEMTKCNVLCRTQTHNGEFSFL